MEFDNFLSRLSGVHKSGGQYTARCPAHDDRHQSLSVSLGSGGKILLNCHAGCKTEAIVGALGLSVRDLFTEDKPQQSQKKFVTDTYAYPGGVQKLRYSDKTFAWRKPNGKGGWEYTRRDVPHSLYIRGELSGIIFAVEGEKDVDNLHKLGYTAVSGEDGAGEGKWKKEYTEQLRGQVVIILPDNDPVGRDYAREAAGALYGVAQSVRLCDLSVVWPEIPDKGNISDMMEDLEQECFLAMLDAVRAFSPERGYKFTTYLTRASENRFRAILGMKRNDPLNVSDSLNAPVSSDEADMEAGELIADPGAAGELEKVDDRYTARVLGLAVCRVLSPVQLEVVRCRFYRQYTRPQTARALGITPGAVLKEERRAVMALARDMEVQRLDLEYVRGGI